MKNFERIIDEEVLNAIIQEAFVIYAKRWSRMKGFGNKKKAQKALEEMNFAHGVKFLSFEAKRTMVDCVYADLTRIRPK
jgi:hypothetical protein